MRSKWFKSFLIISLCTSFLFSSSFLYAGGLETVKSGASATREQTRKVVDTALQPGTFEFVENLVKLVGESIDWYFDRLVVAFDRAYVPQISNSVVDGIG